MRGKNEVKQRLDKAKEEQNVTEMIYLGIVHELYTPNMEGKIGEDLSTAKEWYKTEQDPVGRTRLEEIIGLLEWILA